MINWPQEGLKARFYTCMIGVSSSSRSHERSCPKPLIIPAVSKVTLDIICETAFGYKADSLHNPHNELAVAYETLIDLQSGTSLFDYHMNDTDTFDRTQFSKIHSSDAYSWYAPVPIIRMGIPS